MVSGFNPKYAIGYGSSVFFSLKKEQILGYIKRQGYDVYLPILSKLGILDETNVILVPYKK